VRKNLIIQSKKNILSLTILVIAIIFFFLILQLNNNKKVEGVQHNDINLRFGDNFISYIISTEGDMSFNIFGVQNIKDNNSSFEGLLSSVEFNNPNINVVDYQIDTGIVYENYKLFNLVVTAQVLTNKVETADQLLIQFGNEDVTAYDFGRLVIENNASYQNQHIEPSGDYNVGYPSLSLDVSVKNKTNRSIYPSRIYDLTGEISYQFNQSFSFQPKEEKRIKIDSFHKESEENYDFMTITPILSYTLEDNEYVYNMPGVIYGVLDSDVDKIKKIIN
jgi:hypothetical protein